MIFYRSILRELTVTAFAVFSVLLAILLTTQVVKLFDQAAAGVLSSNAIFAMIAFYTLGSFDTLLSLTLYISVLAVLTRVYRDHEMIIWQTTGLAPTQWIKPVLSFALPLALLVAAVSLGFGPWAQQKGNEYAAILKQRDDISSLSPGIFKEAQNLERVYFIENYVPSTGAAHHVFVQNVQDGKVSTVFAKTGYLEQEKNGERYLVLDNGSRYEGTPGRADYRVVDFTQYRVKISQALKPVVDTRSKAASTRDLLHDQNQPNRAELFWRFSLPISTIILALLAIPLAYYNPRSGHTFNLIIALLVYQVYFNLINLLQSTIAEGHSHSLWSLLPLHSAMFMLFVLLMILRQRPLKLLWRHWKGGRA